MNPLFAANGTPTGSQSSAFTALLPLILLFFIFYFLLIRPQQKKARQHRLFLESLKKGDTVITSGGLVGTIYGIAEDVVTLEIADKVRVKVLKNSIIDKQKGEQK